LTRLIGSIPFGVCSIAGQVLAHLARLGFG